MKSQSRRTATLGGLGACLAIGGLWLGLASCSTVPTPIPIVGAPVGSSSSPTLTILSPDNDLTVGKGERFSISWSDADRDSNARIGFSLVDTTTNEAILLVNNLEENDLTGPDSFQVSTQLIAEGRYYLRGTINDDDNPAVSVFATVADDTSTRVEITVTPPGQGPPTVPPVVAVTQPLINLSVAQDDELLVTIQPTADAIPNPAQPFDPDSETTVYLVLDTDTDPTNDDPESPVVDGAGNPVDIIVLREEIIGQGVFDPIGFPVLIDLEEIPPRPDGEPYYIRVTITDRTNTPVHSYSPGTISVVELASGFVDLYDIGREKSGARFYGFNPSANLGSSITSVSDFDADGVGDFVITARFGNPQGAGPVGEAYLIYGINGQRFGDALAANATSKDISGCILEAPAIGGLRSNLNETETPRTEGISDVSFITDISGDGRPEIIVGTPLVWGALDTVDWDPADEDVANNNDQVMVTVSLRRGRQRVVTSLAPNNPNDSDYSGVDDVSISSLFPNVEPETPGNLGLYDLGAGAQQWILISFADILDALPDTAENIDIDTVMANLNFRVYDASDEPANIFYSLTDFTESTTYSTYAENGGDPEVGVDYQPGALAQLQPANVGTIMVNLSDALRQLIDNSLPGELEDDFRILIAPGGANFAGLRSSEYPTADDRPQLVIQYERRQTLSGFGCYPDNLPNNLTAPQDNDNVNFSFAGGMAVVIYSENRDDAGAIPNADGEFTRLESTSVPLDRVGQAFPFGRAIADTTLADVAGFDPAEDERIAGFRVFAGGFDDLNASQLGQGPRRDLFGADVDSLGDLNNDGVPELIFSAPTNERHLQELQNEFGAASTHLSATWYSGSIIVLLGNNWNNPFWRDQGNEGDTATLPFLDHHQIGPFGQCLNPPGPRHIIGGGAIEIFAEDIDDFLGDGQSATDFNLDSVPDILAGAPRNDRSVDLEDSGAAYILYGRPITGDYDLTDADDPVLRTPMLRIRGIKPGDQIGFSQSTGLDVNGDRIDDVFISSPTADFGGVNRATCGNDYNRDGNFDTSDVSSGNFTSCRDRTGSYVFTDDACIAFDYDYDRDIDDDDREVVDCLRAGGTDCCANLVENGFAGVIFGGVYIDGDRDLTQMATTELPGTTFFGNDPGDRAGYDISSAGDFNQDGFGDILIAAPGETRLDSSARERLGIVYLVFGGTHLKNTRWNLSQVGTDDLPGIVFVSPYVVGRPNEAAPTTVGFIGDINADGFGDIAIGNPRADFIDLSFPQGPNAPGSDAAVGRRSDAGDCYVIYGNNFGSNRGR